MKIPLNPGIKPHKQSSHIKPIKVPSYLRQVCEKEQLDFISITEAKHYPNIQKEYQQWIKKKQHGTMEYLAKHEPLKTNPQTLLPNCQSIIIIGLNYYQERPQQDTTKQRGLIARYAWGRDYHKVIKNKLKRVTKSLQSRFPQEKFYFNTDATPLLERTYAEAAQLGYTGKNTMIISLPYGSYFVIGEILTTLKLPSAQQQTQDTKQTQGSCGTCTRCLDVCPTGAITSPYHIDATKCISYLTIEYKGIIPEELRPQIGSWLFGCDICQDVCPHNIRAKITKEPDFTKHIAGSSLEIKAILQIKNQEEFTKVFAGSPVMRAKRENLLRNACIVAANNKNHELLPQLKMLTKDPNKIIAHHAKWAVEQLES